jgi:hypothetical protein
MREPNHVSIFGDSTARSPGPACECRSRCVVSSYGRHRAPSRRIHARGPRTRMEGFLSPKSLEELGYVPRRGCVFRPGHRASQVGGDQRSVDGVQTRTVVPWASATSAVIAAGLGATTCWRSSLVTIISIARYGKKGTGAWPLFASQRTRLELHRVRYGDDRVRPERAKACARPDRCARAAGESARRSWFVLDAQRPCRDPLACALRAEVCNAPASGVASPGTAAESARRNRIAESGVCV